MASTNHIPRRGNLILGALPTDFHARIEPHLEPVTLGLRYFLERTKMPIQHVYFPISGVASTVVTAGRDKQAEVGIFGFEGMSGLAVVMGDDRAPMECFMQVPGEGLRIASDALRDALDEVPALRVFLLKYVQAMMLQTALTAVANAQSRLEERLCRWLLMVHDRMGRDDMPLTHDFLALMLGVRRAGVTTALHLLEERGLVQATRGAIKIVDREGLIVGADGSYGLAEAEYKRLLGVTLREDE